MVDQTYIDAKNLREFMSETEHERQRAKKNSGRYSFPFEFDGTETSKSLPIGWKPVAVYLSGSRQREGAGNDVVFKQLAGVWSVVWDTAPLDTDWAYIDAEVA